MPLLSGSREATRLTASAPSAMIQAASTLRSAEAAAVGDRRHRRRRARSRRRRHTEVRSQVEEKSHRGPLLSGSREATRLTASAPSAMIQAASTLRSAEAAAVGNRRHRSVRMASVGARRCGQDGARRARRRDWRALDEVGGALKEQRAHGSALARRRRVGSCEPARGAMKEQQRS